MTNIKILSPIMRKTNKLIISKDMLFKRNYMLKLLGSIVEKAKKIRRNRTCERKRKHPRKKYHHNKKFCI